jgi:SpoVK/Ycf46/Vps4 family AAA+-type ATPase
MPEATIAPVLTEGLAYPTLRPLIRQSLHSGASVLLRGKPGVGKSSLAYELATEDFRLPLCDIRLAQKDPAELAGVYVPNRETKTLELYAPDWVRACCREPHFLFLDEINAAVTKLHQAASYSIVFEHRVGPFAFHAQTVVMAAGNFEEDEALAVPLSTALQNRFRHFSMRVDAEAWLLWAAKQGLSPDIMAFISAFREHALHRRTGEYAYATPRSWADAAKIENLEVPERQRRALIASCVGASITDEFWTFLKVYRRVDIPAILSRGEIPSLGGDPSFTWALTNALAHLLRHKGLSKEQAPNLLKLFSCSDYTDEYIVLLLKMLDGTKVFNALMSDGGIGGMFRPVKDRILGLMTAE